MPKPKPWDIKRTNVLWYPRVWSFWAIAGRNTLVLEPMHNHRIIESIHLFLNPIDVNNTVMLEAVRAAKFEVGAGRDTFVSIHLANLQSTMQQQAGTDWAILYDGTPPTYLNARIDLWLDFPILLVPEDSLWVSLPGVHNSTDITFHLHFMGYNEGESL